MAEWTAISGGSFDYVQGSTPSGAEGGETWLDTSVNPPEEFVYNGTSWVKTASGNLIEQNLDAPVSEAKGGIDWQSKTYVSENEPPGGELSVSGSGYLLYVSLEAPANETIKAAVNIDSGSLTFGIPLEKADAAGVNAFCGPPMRFESSLDIYFVGGTLSNREIDVVYILD